MKPLTVPQVADELGVSEWSVYRLTKAGHLGRVPHIGAVLVPRAELDRFIALGVLDSDPTPPHGIERPA